MKKKVSIILCLGLVIICLLIYNTVIFINNHNNVINSNEVVDNENKDTTDDIVSNDDSDISISNGTYTYNKFDLNNVKYVSDDDTLSNNIVINKLFMTGYYSNSKYNEVYVYGTNNNSEAVVLKLNLNFYDSAGMRIKKQTAEIRVFGNTDFVDTITLLDDSYSYVSVELEISAKKLYSYYKEVSLNDLELTYDKSTSGISGLVKNNSQQSIFYLDLGCLYYKNGEVVFADNAFASDTNPGSSASFSIHKFKLLESTDVKSNSIDYDNYKVFIIDAIEYVNEFN